jgi:hypothetical protein
LVMNPYLMPTKLEKKCMGVPIGMHPHRHMKKRLLIMETYKRRGDAPH